MFTHKTLSYNVNSTI